MKHYIERINELESTISQKDSEINRLKNHIAMLQTKHDKLYENLERFTSQDTVDSYSVIHHEQA